MTISYKGTSVTTLVAERIETPIYDASGSLLYCIHTYHLSTRL